MSIATWVLGELRAVMPQEPIFDGPRSAFTFDGRPVAADVTRCVVVHTVMPSHEMVTVTPTKDLSRAQVIVHAYATTRNEVEARQAKIITALKNRTPSDDRYEWSMFEHSESRREDPDPAVPGVQFHTIDVFRVAGFEK
jgi:hypothetical protein